MASIQMQWCVGSKYSGHANMHHAKICTTLHVRFFSSVLWPIFANVIKKIFVVTTRYILARIIVNTTFTKKKIWVVR